MIWMNNSCPIRFSLLYNKRVFKTKLRLACKANMQLSTRLYYVILHLNSYFQLWFCTFGAFGTMAILWKTTKPERRRPFNLLCPRHHLSFDPYFVLLSENRLVQNMTKKSSIPPFAIGPKRIEMPIHSVQYWKLWHSGYILWCNTILSTKIQCDMFNGALEYWLTQEQEQREREAGFHFQNLS